MIEVGKQHQSGGYLVVEIEHDRAKYGDDHARGFIHKRIKPKDDVWYAFYGRTYGSYGRRVIGTSPDKAAAVRIVTDHIGAHMARKRKTSTSQTSLFGASSTRKPPSTKGAKWSRREGYKPVRVRVEGHTRVVYKRKA